ncbi:TAXI family TRAP transporter solute-binding subunit [uncultured Roseibium sp.]|uniref:TAXI family TRAP transporter solute-binding subunit n=1 Tax=uncultured Roseibium sp. TaxID=1936171 RepID=UPI00261A2082|nr:TAXI family TRAP transporter solute-binding subunit [uncultured Roseibium sp.]
MRLKPRFPGVFLAAFLVLAGAASAQQFVTLGTAGVTGVYYPAGGAICRLVNLGRKDHGIRCLVESTGGSVQNANSVRDNTLDFAIVQSDIQAASLQGTGAFAAEGPDTELRSLFSLHAEPMHLMARAEAGIKGPEDLKGKDVNIGNPGSGTLVMADLLLKYTGLSSDDLSLAADLSSTEQVPALCNDKLDASIWVAGLPNASTQEAVSTCDIRLVPIAGDAIDKLLAENPAYAAAVIPGGLYQGNPDDVPTWGPKATVVTSARMPEEVVYTIVAAVFDNFEDFKKLHPALERLTPQDMIKEGLTADLHPGALKYYREQGWL